MPRKRKKVKKQPKLLKAEPQDKDLKAYIGKIVAYFANGWHFGTLEHMGYKRAKIRPVGAIGVKVVKCKNVNREDVKVLYD